MKVGNFFGPSYRAQNGRLFASDAQRAVYDRAQQDLNRARGGHPAEEAYRLHGQARKITLENDGAGRWRLTSHHADGFTHTSVHPHPADANKYHDLLVGLDNPPMGIETNQRNRAAGAIGPREDQLVREADHRVE